MGTKIAVKVDEVRGTITVANPAKNSSDPPKVFTFDRVFAPECKQTDVYNDGARPIVESVLEGYNGRLCSRQALTLFIEFRIPKNSYSSKQPCNSIHAIKFCII